jgi:hypothetical protein
VGAERRCGDRRQRVNLFAVDRRSGRERRHWTERRTVGERRMLGERRFGLKGR